jgi:hypothetical protein
MMGQVESVLAPRVARERERERERERKREKERPDGPSGIG